MGVMQAAHERGLRIPADLAVIGFDGLPLTAFTSPPLSTVEQPVAAMSAAAIAMLLDRIRGTAPMEPRTNVSGYAGGSRLHRRLCIGSRMNLQHQTVKLETGWATP